MAVFKIQLRAFLWGLDDGWLFFKWGSMLYYFNNGWVMVGSFSNFIVIISSRIWWWLAVYQMWFKALLLSQWLGNGWQFFKFNWEPFCEGWMMVGCFSNEVQCSITLTMVGSWLAVFQIQLRTFLWGLDDGWLFFKKGFNAFLLHQWLGHGWQFFNIFVMHI